MNKDNIKLCIEHFFTHPHWQKCLDVIETYIEPLKDLNSIDTEGKSSDEVFAEVKGRQIAYDTLKRFIDESLTVRKALSSVPKNKRKFK